jgi:hypothetical protein
MDYIVSNILSRSVEIGITSTEPIEVPKARRLCVFSAIAIAFTAGAQTIQQDKSVKVVNSESTSKLL